MSRPSWEDKLAAISTSLVIAGVLAIAALLVATLTELVRVYKSRALQDTRSAHHFWIALAALIATWTLAALLATNPHLTAPAAYLVAWSFLVFVIVVEGYDSFLARDEKSNLQASSTGLLEFEAPEANQDGHVGLPSDEVLQEGVVLGEDITSEPF